MGCLKCGAKIKQTKGKREKLFCSDSCRSSYWQKQKSIAKKEAQAIIMKAVNVNDLNVPLPVELKGFLAKSREAVGLPPEPPPTSEKWVRRETPKMPKGLSLAQQILWKAENKTK
jgi:hypothetical protein